MKYLALSIASLIGIGATAGAVLAQTGPLYAAVPANICPSAVPLKLVWIANEVASDGAVGPGPGYAETMVVCHSTMKTGSSNIDVWVELFDFGGNSVGTGSICDLKPGNTASFITGGLLIPPYLGAVVGPAVLNPPGSLRVMATKPKVVCDVTLYDTGGPVAGITWGPLWSKDVTVTKATAPQKGD